MSSAWDESNKNVTGEIETRINLFSQFLISISPMNQESGVTIKNIIQMKLIK